MKTRVTNKISCGERRAQDLKEKERARKDTQIPPNVTQAHADQLAVRLQGGTAEPRKELGSDLELQSPGDNLVYIEVKGRVARAHHVTLLTSELRRANNVPERFRVAVVVVDGDTTHVRVCSQGFDFGRPGLAQNSSPRNLRTPLQHGGTPE